MKKVNKNYSTVGKSISSVRTAKQKTVVDTIKITNIHKRAGILEIYSKNYNGSYTCLVDLQKVDLKNTQSNPRRHSKNHGEKISSNWFQRCVRNPILRYNEGTLTSIDGRHTSCELIRRGDFIVTAEVHFDVTDAESARIFHDLTVNSKRIDLWDAHVCALHAEMKHAVDIQKALDTNKLVCKGPNVKPSQCDVSSYNPLMEAWQASGDRLEKLCFILSKVYRNKRTGRVIKLANSCEFMRAIIDLCEHPQYVHLNAPVIARELSCVDIYKVNRLSSQYASIDRRVRPGSTHWLMALLNQLEIVKKAA